MEYGLFVSRSRYWLERLPQPSSGQRVQGTSNGCLHMALPHRCTSQNAFMYLVKNPHALLFRDLWRIRGILHLRLQKDFQILTRTRNPPLEASPTFCHVLCGLPFWNTGLPFFQPGQTSLPESWDSFPQKNHVRQYIRYIICNTVVALWLWTSPSEFCSASPVSENS